MTKEISNEARASFDLFHEVGITAMSNSFGFIKQVLDELGELTLPETEFTEEVRLKKITAKHSGGWNDEEEIEETLYMAYFTDGAEYCLDICNDIVTMIDIAERVEEFLHDNESEE